MATRLKNLKIRKVDFVDEGANPDAHIRMIKRKESEGQSSEEDGRKESEGIWKKVLSFIGKAAGIDQSEIDSAVEDIQKGSSMSFTERINAVNNGKIADEMWDVCYALQSSLCSILNDEDMDGTGAATAMQESLDEFYAVVKESISKWSSGKEVGIVKKNEEASEPDLKIMKAAVERLNESIEKAVSASGRPSKDALENNEIVKGDEEEMKIDKSKLTPAERAFLENIEKRCKAEEGDGQDSGGAAETEGAPAGAEAAVTKSVLSDADTVSAPQTEEGDDIYKGIHPAVKAELERLRKFREQAEEKELTDIAKKYEIIGKKQEELVPVLKSLREAGGTAYNDMIAMLDQMVDVVEKSGVFGEIGKVGGNHSPMDLTKRNTEAEVKAENIAKGYLEKNPDMSYQEAIAKAWEDNPDLLDAYDEQAGF